jgi:hypothetical protein
VWSISGRASSTLSMRNLAIEGTESHGTWIRDMDHGQEHNSGSKKTNDGNWDGRLAGRAPSFLDHCAEHTGTQAHITCIPRFLPRLSPWLDVFSKCTVFELLAFISPCSLIPTSRTTMSAPGGSTACTNPISAPRGCKYLDRAIVNANYTHAHGYDLHSEA